MISKEFQELMRVDTIATAKALLGMQLCLDGKPVGRIVETEAYLGAKDSACHSAHGKRSPKMNLCIYQQGIGMSIRFTVIRC